MSRFLQFLRSRLVVKLSLATLFGIALGFALVAIIHAKRQEALAKSQQQVAAHTLTASMVAGIRTAMLHGNPLTVRKLLRHLRANVKDTIVRIYDPAGHQVFGRRGRKPKPDELPPPVREALTTKGTILDRGIGYHAIVNQKKCRTCHRRGDLRGVLALRSQTGGVGGGRLAQMVELAFKQIMVAGKSKLLGDYFEDLTKKGTGITGIEVKNVKKETMFIGGKPKAGPGVALHEITLKREQRCLKCHQKSGPIRGYMTVALTPKAGKREGLEKHIEISMQYIMLAGLGRLIAAYMDAAAKKGAARTLKLYDRHGRLYHDVMAKPKPPGTVAEVLESGKPVGQMIGEGDKERWIAVVPLKNDKSCQVCHGSEKPLRGAIQVVTSNATAARERVAASRRTVWFGAGTAFVVFLILWLASKRIVIGPVQRMGEAAKEIGEGNLDVEVDDSSPDEVGQLAHGINDMVKGLRQKIHLEKFVSQETKQHVEAASTLANREGVRRRGTVLFTDIRGFTAYSETVAPEQVVAMLNLYLGVQAEVVHEFGGDIDKFVGDEIMAVFRGDDMESRATRCALEMVARVQKVRTERGEKIAVGAGISTGEMVIGGVGHENRMDFTVIGDAVNLGARLCGAAEPGEVLLSGATKAGAAQIAGVAFEAVAPMKVKGKKDPVEVWRANRVEEST